MAYQISKSGVIGIHLFHALDATNAEQARRCIAVATDVRASGRFDLDSILHLSQSYTTVEDWFALLALVEEALGLFGTNGRLRAVRAFALDKLGRTPEAMEDLRELVGSGVSDKVAVNTYINIVTRCGFTEEAIKLVENLLGRESDKSKRLEYLRLLFGLTHRADPHGQRAESIAWRIGQISNQPDEAEEGLFLISYLAATVSAKVMVSPERKAELHERLSRFTQKYPTSNLLRGAALPSNPSVQDLERIVEQVTGQDSEARREQQKLLLQLQRGVVPIPFAMRPRYALTNVSDVTSLWELTKRSAKDAHQYHLTMTLDPWSGVDPRAVERDIPLLDLITLFVAKDLQLFDVIFGLFPRIAIGQATLLHLQHLAQPMTGSWAQQECSELIEMLKGRFTQIVQPTANKETNIDYAAGRAAYDEVQELVQQGRFVLYSDDALYRLIAGDPLGTASLSVLLMS